MRVIVFIVGLIAAISCSFEEEWRAILYPTAESLLESELVGISGSLEQCRSMIQARASELNLIPSQYDYECGLNCEAEKSALFRSVEAELRRNPEDSAALAQKAQLEAYGMDTMLLCKETVK